MKLRCFFVSVSCLLTGATLAQPMQAWYKLTSILPYDSPGAIALDASGNVFVASTCHISGAPQDISVHKLSPAGALLWSRRLGRSDYDYVTSMVVDNTGSVIIGGTTTTLSYTLSRPIVVKYDSAGTLKWIRLHTGTSSQGSGGYFALATNSVGDVYAAGSVTNTSTGEDAVIRKYSAAGAILWTRLYAVGGSAHNRFSKMVMNSMGDVFAGGPIQASPSYSSFMRVSPTGAVKWVKTFSSPGKPVSFHAMALDPTGNLATLNSERESNASNPTLIVSEYATDTGAFSLSPRRFASPAGKSQNPLGFAVDKAGSFVILKDYRWTENQVYRSQRFLQKLSYGGIQLWMKELTPADQAAEAGFLIVDDKNAIYTGSNFSDIGTQTTYARLIKFSPAGAKLWQIDPKRPAPGTSLVSHGVRRATGEIYTVGYSQPQKGATSSDNLIMKIIGG